MSDKQKAMRERINELNKENTKIQNARHQRDMDAVDLAHGTTISRALRRMSEIGSPRIRWHEKMAIPKKKR